MLNSALEILKYYSGYFMQKNFFNDILVFIGWGLMNFLKTFCNGAEALLDGIYQFMDFTSSEPVQNFIRQFQPVLYILFAFALMVLGYTLIIMPEKRSKHIIRNFAMVIIIVTALPSIMSSLNQLTIAGREWINPVGESTANNIVIENITDLRWLDSNGWPTLETIGSQRMNNLLAEDVGYLNPQETVGYWNYHNTEAQTTLGSEVFWNTLVADGQGQFHLEKMNKTEILGITIFEEPWYYRYSIDYLTIYISLIAMTLALFFTALKTARIIFELGEHQFLAVFFGASDLSNGQKTIEVLKGIGGMYVTLFLTTVFLKFFLLLQDYVNGMPNVNGLVKAFMILFCALAVIDGPNLIQRILGIDAGLSSGFHFMMGAMHAGHSTTNLLRSAGRAAAAPIRSGIKTVRGYSAKKKMKGTSTKNESAKKPTSNVSEKTQSGKKAGSSSATQKEREGRTKDKQKPPETGKTANKETKFNDKEKGQEILEPNPVATDISKASRTEREQAMEKAKQNLNKPNRKLRQSENFNKKVAQSQRRGRGPTDRSAIGRGRNKNGTI